MKNFIFSLFVLLLLPAYMSGQAQAIKGKVVDSSGMGIPGAIIASSDARATADADFDGNFTINAKPGDILKVSMLGFDAVSVPATAAPMTITLKDSQDTALKEVVVIGYGTRKKVDNTTAISSIKAEEITRTKVMNASQAIQGKAAGVQVTSSDVPGSTPSVVIRGVGTALGGRTPLYVVDGMPTENINNINTNDIVSYEILKDASSLAIYGTRGANGVIMITTKSGKGNRVTVEVESFGGVRTPLKKVKMANSSQFAAYTNAALGANTFSENQPVNTNWFDEITRTGSYTQNNVSVSGSSENIKYFFSLGNYEEKGILNGLDYGRTTFRNNNEYKISKKVTLTQNFSFSSVKSSPQPLSAFTNAYRQSPIVPVYFPDGKFGVPFVANGVANENGSIFNRVENPVSQLSFYDEQQRSVMLQGGLKLDYTIIDGLKFTSQFNGEYYNWKQYNYVDTKGKWLAADPTRIESNYPASGNINVLTKGREQYFNWNLSNYLTYNKVFANIHDVELTAGIETNVKGHREKLTIDRKNVTPDSNYWSPVGDQYNFAGDILKYQDESYNELKLASYFARFQYKLLDRYLLTGTVRRDGSSNYANDYRWGTFPSFGIGWIMTKEKFLSDIKGIDLIKLRGGWGKLGNQNVPLNAQTFSSGYGYYFPGLDANGNTINIQVDPTLSWEIVEETGVGLDFELLNNRLKGTFDVYDKETKNTILYTKPLMTSGIDQQAARHVGKVSNKGYEISLRWDDKINDNLSYWIGGNYAYNKNELVKITDSQIVPTIGGGLGNGQDTKILDYSSAGRPLGSFYLYEYAGIDPSNGSMLYYNSAGQKVTQNLLDGNKDKKYFGSVLPSSTYGVTLGLVYKNVDFSVDGYGTGGAKVYNGKKAQRSSGENVEASVATNFWTPTNTTAANPAPFNQIPVASTYYMESGDFFRINNITLGYKLPLKEDQFISSCRIYINAINPFITQKFSGFTPELNGDGDPTKSQGVELDAYPALRSFVIGANFKF